MILLRPYRSAALLRIQCCEWMNHFGFGSCAESSLLRLYMQTETKGNQKFAIESESMFCDSQWTLAVLLFRCVLPFVDWKFVFLNFGKSDAHARHVVGRLIFCACQLLGLSEYMDQLYWNKTGPQALDSIPTGFHGITFILLGVARVPFLPYICPFKFSSDLRVANKCITELSFQSQKRLMPQDIRESSNISNVGATFCYHSSCCKSSGINVWCRWGINKLSISALTCKDSSICWRLHFARKLRAAKLRTETITCQRATCEGVQNAATKNRINSKLASNCQTNPVESRHVVEGFSFHILCFMLRCWSD